MSGVAYIAYTSLLNVDTSTPQGCGLGLDVSVSRFNVSCSSPRRRSELLPIDAIRLGFKICLSKTKTKTKTQQFQDQD